METSLSDLSKETLKLSPQKYGKWPTKHLYVASLSTLQLFGTLTLNRMSLRLKWSRDAQPGGPRTIMPERLASLHCCTRWAGKHLTRNSYSYYDIVYAMLSNLGWRSREYGRYGSRLAKFYKIQYGLVAVSYAIVFRASH